jgi:guanosine-3',5'-bis(diphosphate) 3'-pyrophosphohydrolase
VSTEPAHAGGAGGAGGVAVWQQAASFAAWKHRHQIRKDGRTPYITHPFRVAMTVRTVFGCDDPIAIAAALLHDTIEDTLTDYDELHDRFGTAIADIVAALTKNMALPDMKREADYDHRLAAADWRAKLVKLGDVFDNYSDLPQRTPQVLADMDEKCRRAMVIAERDAGAHQTLRTAIEAVRSLMHTRD